MTVVASNYARKENDLYQTEPWATEALLRRFPIKTDYRYWEPAAGNHLIADVLSDRGANVFTSDIKTYDKEHNGILDFLNSQHRYNCLKSAIVTNPPYGKGNRDAVKFCELALQRADFVAMLLTAKFDFGKTRHHLFRDNTRFTAKINLVDRISWEGNGMTGTEDHAWYVWTPHGSPNGPIIYYEGKIA